ncbi:hypothetical protein [Demequina lutea]|uniref:Uncharacterized protein n=1 Tax=Demequina lutea TaxID=431489 RepID=A0A7Y9Z7A2_9MICO|nr:hypothetical protein [Demequina lutea]NYI39921.1 hypothetical protein [Demequina lutea]
MPPFLIWVAFFGIMAGFIIGREKLRRRAAENRRRRLGDDA